MELTKVLESIETAWLIYLLAYILSQLFLLGLAFFWSKRGSYTVEKEERLDRIARFNVFSFNLVIILFHLVLIPGHIAIGGLSSALVYIIFLPAWRVRSYQIV